jgi:aryl-phospho-beta-D-glucosidase BglC (GH1 family)
MHVPLRVLTLALVLWGAGRSGAAAPNPFLKTSGLAVRNNYGQGDVVPLRGVNLGSWLLMEPWMCPMNSTTNLPDDWSVRETLTQRFGAAARDSLIGTYEDAWLQASDFDRIAALGMNVIRLPFWYLNLQEEDGTWRADAFNRMDWAISNAWKRGIYTILDFHGVHGGQRAHAGSTGRLWPTAALWTSTAEQDRMVETWRRISEHYSGNPAVAGYDLLNEPMDTPSQPAYWNLLHRCYTTIRTNDPDHIIVMEATYGSWNFDMLPSPAAYGWTNVVYQLHVYPWDIWYDVPQLNATADSTVQDWMNHQGWNVPCHIGEFNMAPEEAWKYAIEKYSTNGAGWQMWAFKSTYTGGTTSGGRNGPPRTPSPSTRATSAPWPCRWPMMMPTRSTPIPS